jgi:glycerophosphoryl diester phosphodiesterase
MRPAIYAHRFGRAYGPDSSGSALAHVLQGRVEGLETDCCLTADGDVVLLHDPFLDVGTTMTGWAHEHPADRICASRLRHADGTPSQDPPLRLDDLLGRAPHGVRLQLEIKAYADPDLALRTAQVLCDRLAAHPARDRIEIISFWSGACALAAGLGFRTRLIIISEHTIAALAQWARRAGVHGVCVEHFLLSPALVATLRAAGLSVTTGTVNHPAMLARLLPLGLDAITSDTPHALRHALDAAAVDLPVRATA